jgi:hypothetical protein
MNPINNKDNAKPLKTPVLFLVFNRLDTTRQVFHTIWEAKPPRLYLASDGARASKEDETGIVQAVRDFIMSNIDWECEVKTLFRNENLGCRNAVSGAIDWFFENEEMGIILEDDCLPCSGFFGFCETLLEKYKNDTRIMCISGNNFSPGKFDNNYSYFLSEIPFIWGWATWRRAWKLNDHTLNVYKEIQPLNISLSSNPKASKMWWKRIGKTVSGLVDTWDYLWTFTNLINNGLTIIPKNNLVTNIGIGHVDSTHTNKVKQNFVVDTYNIDFPLIHPPFIKPNYKFDTMMYKNNFNVNPLWKRIIKRLKIL